MVGLLEDWTSLMQLVPYLGRPRHAASLLTQQRVEEVRQNSCTVENDYKGQESARLCSFNVEGLTFTSGGPSTRLPCTLLHLRGAVRAAEGWPRATWKAVWASGGEH